MKDGFSHTMYNHFEYTIMLCAFHLFGYKVVIDLKCAFTSAFVLYDDPKKPFIIEIDASNFALKSII